MGGKQGSEDGSGGSGSLDRGRNCQSREQQSLEAGRDRWTGSFFYQSLQGPLSPGGPAGGGGEADSGPPELKKPVVLFQARKLSSFAAPVISELTIFRRE